MTKATSGDDKYSHIEEKDLQTVIEKCANTQKWLDDMEAKQAERMKSQPPAFTSTDINKRREEVTYACLPIFNRAKPKPKTEKAPEAPPKADGDAEMPAEEPKKAEPEMDID